MLIHIGNNVSLFLEDILLILNIENIEDSGINQELVKCHEIINKDLKGAKSILIAKDPIRDKYIGYKSNLSSRSLMKRSREKY